MKDGWTSEGGRGYDKIGDLKPLQGHLPLSPLTHGLGGAGNSGTRLRLGCSPRPRQRDVEGPGRVTVPGPVETSEDVPRGHGYLGKGFGSSYCKI